MAAVLICGNEKEKATHNFGFYNMVAFVKPEMTCERRLKNQKKNVLPSTLTLS